MTDATAPHEIALVTTTVASEAEARQLAQGVIGARLAACVQVEAITSHYRWEGAVQEERELRLACKTLPSAVPALLAWLQAHHPYTLPQLVVQPLAATVAYGGWVAEQLAPPAATAQ